MRMMGVLECKMFYISLSTKLYEFVYVAKIMIVTVSSEISYTRRLVHMLRWFYTERLDASSSTTPSRQEDAGLCAKPGAVIFGVA